MARVSRREFALSLVAGGAAMACQSRRVVTPGGKASPAAIAELWVDPGTTRDLFHGVGGARLAPDPAAAYRVIR